MRETRILYFALGVVLVVSVGAVSLHDNGVEFPDGSFQETAAAGFTAANAVQGQVSLATEVGGSECSAWTTLFQVPANKRLVIEWLAAESSIPSALAALSHPVDVDIVTHDGMAQVFYRFIRLDDQKVVGPSVFSGTRWAAPVRLYSEASQPVQVRMFLNKSLNGEGVGPVGFSGYLIDV
ncbi:MAG: hypothetical protein GY769_01635 [bacterium]|nr:hypothetical protein [bacterium]